MPRYQSESGDKSPHSKWFAVVIVFVVLFAVPILAQKKATPTPSVQPTATPEPTQPPSIPLPQIAPRADEAIQKLREMSDQLSHDPESMAIEQTLKSQEGFLNEKLHELNELFSITPIRFELQDVEKEWIAQKSLYAGLLKSLTARAKAAEEDKHFLENQQAEWTNTQQQIKDPAATETVFGRIQDVLTEIQNTTQQANEQLKTLLRLQDEVSQQNKLVSSALRTISQEKKRLQRSLLEPDSPPIWKASLSMFSGDSQEVLALTFKRNLERTAEFFKTRPYALPGVVGLFLIALSMSLLLSPRMRSWINNHPEAGISIEPFSRPISLALLVVLIVVLPFMVKMPIQPRAVILVVSLVPVLRLVGPLIKPVFRSLLYVLVIFGTSAWFWETFISSSGWKRAGVIVLITAAIAIVVWLTRDVRRNAHALSKTDRLVLFTVHLCLLVFVLALAANIFGFAGLSRILRSGTVLSAYSAVILRTAYLILKSICAPRISTAEGRAPEPTVIRWSLRILAAGGILLWVSLALDFFTVSEPVIGFISRMLTTPIRVRAASITLEDVLSFILVLAGGVFLAGIFRVVLKENILERMNLKRGIPYAISTISYYVVLLMVFLFALSAAGVELSRLTVLTGAFGLGVGFGMQNVISNFVSGIILLFERPIRIGDFLEVDTAKGEVIRMGMRSSSIRTAQGAEVIVPNSSLMSTQVVNWTLTSKQRRTELPIRVAYGADTEKVSRILVETACSHPQIATKPSPEAFLLGFGDNSLNFELWFWVPRGVLPPRVTSQIATEITRRFRDEGIEVPVPRRELLVSTVDPSVKEAMGAGDDFLEKKSVHDAQKEVASPLQNT